MGMRFVGFWGRGVGSGKGKANCAGGGGGGGLIRSALTTGIRGLEKKRGKNGGGRRGKGKTGCF